MFSTDLDAHTLSADLPVGVPSRGADAPAGCHGGRAPAHRGQRQHWSRAGCVLSQYLPDRQLRHGQPGALRAVQVRLRRLDVLAADHVPIFTGGANVASLDLAKIEKNVYIAQYEKTLQSAFREVDDALAARETLDDQLAAQRALLDDRPNPIAWRTCGFAAASTASCRCWTRSACCMLRNRPSSSVELQRLQNLATLYKALGGGMKRLISWILRS